MKYCPLHLINTKRCQICTCWQSQWRLGEEKHSSSIEKSVRQATSNVSSTLGESVQTFGEKCLKLCVMINNQKPTKRKNLLKKSNQNQNIRDKDDNYQLSRWISESVRVCPWKRFTADSETLWHKTTKSAHGAKITLVIKSKFIEKKTVSIYWVVLVTYYLTVLSWLEWLVAESY